MIKISENRITVETKTLTAEIIDGNLVKLADRLSGSVYINDARSDVRPPLSLVYPQNRRVDLDPTVRGGSMEIYGVSETRADIYINSWFGSGIISVCEDVSSGDLIIEPSAFSSMPGVQSVRWDIAGICESAKMILPVFQGCVTSMDDPMIRGSRFQYPFRWESPFAVFHFQHGGMWVRTEDSSYLFRSISIGDGSEFNRIGLETETCGPIKNNLSAGSCAWRINVYRGESSVPIEHYRAFLYKKLDLDTREKQMPDWMRNVRLAYSWCPTDRNILTSLKKYIDPKKVIIHLPRWRNDGYDQNYPDYTPSAEAIAFFKEASEMGYHVSPHFNAFEIDPTRPEFELVRDFRYREADTGVAKGWAWDKSWYPVPEDNLILRSSQRYNVMTKIHPGHAMWRYLLTKNISKAVQMLDTDIVFIDVTHGIFNLETEYVNNLTCGEGVVKLLRNIAEIKKVECVGGEGLNEVTVQGQYFAQGHAFSPQNGAPKTTVDANKLCPVNATLYKDVCKLIGYHSHVNDREAMKLTFDLDCARGFLPTLIGIGSKDLESPDETVREILDRATD
jgi:hypothetical protein